MRILTATASLLLLAPASWARIGETREQCTERYGEAVTSIPQQLKKSDGPAEVHRFRDLQVVIEYRAGKAWVVSYNGRSLHKRMVEMLLAKNSEDAKWENGTFFGAMHWIAKEKGLRAVYHGSPLSRLLLMTEASLDAERNPPVKPSDRVEVPGKGETTDPTAEPEKKDGADPLEGF